MSDSERSQLLRAARTRALARLRAEQDDRFQVILDEEIQRLGGEPRTQARRPYRPRNAMSSEVGR